MVSFMYHTLEEYWTPQSGIKITLSILKTNCQYVNNVYSFNANEAISILNINYPISPPNTQTDYINHFQFNHIMLIYNVGFIALYFSPFWLKTSNANIVIYTILVLEHNTKINSHLWTTAHPTQAQLITWPK